MPFGVILTLFTMPGPPGELMTREKIIFREWHQNSRTYGHVTNLFLELKFQHKGNKQTKKGKFSANLLVLSAGIDSDIKIIKMLHRKGQKKIGQICHLLGQEPTFNIYWKVDCLCLYVTRLGSWEAQELQSQTKVLMNWLTFLWFELHSFLTWTFFRGKHMVGGIVFHKHIF